MMNIFIMEECLYRRRRLEKIINEISDERKIKVRSVIATSRIDNITEKISEQGRHQLFFLDTKIKKNEEKGFDLAKKIREKDPNSTIVFITNNINLGIRAYAYKISALDFILKNLNEREFKKSIENCMVHVNKNISKAVSKDAFYFSNRQVTFQLPFSDILYFETLTGTHKLKIITKKSSFEFYDSLKKIEKIDKRLFRCHRSYIANLENVISVNKKNYLLHFENDTQCYISRRKLAHIVEYLTNK